ncbi:MAG: FAD-binding oxidoreductase [Gammaproteobacteria bacterium]|nr:FAD-binding oxidoreductase [Gammaproteobacteria bacterium]MDH3449453.1 FAD-binding oxidoreductase [Gammaproteobacteria bacterium]
MNQPVLVLGAGIVGISCALELQKRGYRVTLMDRRGPGEEASSGNAGILSLSNITPLADPALLTRLHRLALNLDTDLLLHYPHLPALLPWLGRFLRRCRRATYLVDGAAMALLTQASMDLHRQWIDEAGLQSLANRGGGLKLYRDRRSFLRDQLERELLERCGVRHTLVDAAQVQDLEPDLNPVFVQGVLIDESISIRDPEKLCKAYAQMFVAAGGQVKQAEIRSIRQSGGGWELSGSPGVVSAERLVVCMGAWTPGLIGQLGYANPLAIERGYHAIAAPAEGRRLSRPIFDVDASYVMAPMEMGLRITTGSNLVRCETRPDPRQLVRVLPRAREAFPIERILTRDPWMGRRPTVPDTLPLIGPAPRHQNLWLAFAHSHMGLTMGPITGVLIANFVGAEPQPFATKAYDPSRYL